MWCYLRLKLRQVIGRGGRGFLWSTAHVYSSLNSSFSVMERKREERDLCNLLSHIFMNLYDYIVYQRQLFCTQVCFLTINKSFVYSLSFVTGVYSSHNVIESRFFN